MFNYIFGSASTLTVLTMVEIFADKMPNDFVTSLETILPF